MTTEHQLQAFATDSALVRLLDHMGQPGGFNLFEALGATRQELRHSHLLAYLLAPQQPHGLGAWFLHHFLSQALSDAPTIEMNTEALAQTRVHPEWSSIDLLLELPPVQTIIIIENKIDSSEHSNQLARYVEVAARRYPGWTLYGIYLTPDGHLPSDSRYRAVSYAAVVAAVESLLRDTTPIPDDVRMVLNHYASILRRYIVPDTNSELAQLARRLYSEYEAAIEKMINLHDQRMKRVEQICITLITEQHPHLVPDQSHRSGKIQHIRCYPPAWDTDDLRYAQWTASRLLLLIEFTLHHQGCCLHLTVGKGDGNGPMADELRKILNTIAQQHQPPFNVQNNHLGDFFRLYEREIFAAESEWFAQFTDADIEAAIRSHWEAFLRDDLPAMQAILQPELEQLTRRNARLDRIENLCITLIEEQGERLVRDTPHWRDRTRLIRCYPPAWDTDDLRHAQWTASRLLLLIEFTVTPERCFLHILVGPGNGPKAHTMRAHLNSIARQHQPPFTHHDDHLLPYFGIYTREIFSPESNWFAQLADTDIEAAIRSHWEAFLRDDLPAMQTILQRELELAT
jgi:hypothetical protein